MASDITLPPTTLLSALNSSCPRLGEIVSYNGIYYRFVKHVNAITVVVGHVALSTVAGFTDGRVTIVTNDTTGGTVEGNATHCVGIYVSIPTAAIPYCFLQVTGVALVLGDGSVAAEEYVIPKTDGEADSMGAGDEHKVFGYALDADDTANDPLAASPLFHCHLTACGL
jgi:hypothetical protein